MLRIKTISKHSKATILISASIHDSIDKQNEARVYSRIARRFQLYGQEVDDGCGRNYYADFLYAHQLEITRNLFGKK